MNCSYCKKQAQFKCDCDQPFFCNEHVGRHMVTYRNHEIENIDLEVEVEKLRSSKSKILKRLEKILEAKAEITSKSKTLIVLTKKLNL